MAVSILSNPQTCREKPPVIMVGNTEIATLVAKRLEELNVRVEADPFCEDRYVFCRDSRVVLSDGSQLIPYPIKNPNLSFYFRALLPESSRRFIFDPHSTGYGFGFDPRNVVNVHRAAKMFDISTIQAKTCTEGGNCFIYKDKAIVGKHSVILSLIALEEQSFLDDKILREQLKDESLPDSSFLRMARNALLHKEHEKKCKDGEALFGDSDYEVLKLAFISPLTDSPTEECIELAKLLQLKWEITLETMAIELGVDKNNLIIMDQNAFHIDMDIAISPNDFLFINDPEKASQSLEDVHVVYKHSACEFEVMQKNIAKLKALGLEIIRVPAAYNCHLCRINFINGLFLENERGVFFLSNGAEGKFKVLEREFSKRLREHQIETIFFECTGKVLALYNGGLHCLTWIR